MLSVVWIMLKIWFSVNSSGRFLIGILVESRIVIIRNEGFGIFVWLIVFKVVVMMIVM